MEQKAIVLESLLDMHDAPFRVIDAQGLVLAVNQAALKCYGGVKNDYIGQPCCPGSTGQCRHHRFFRTLEPYAGRFPVAMGEGGEQDVRGYPLLDSQGTIMLGELITPLHKHPGSGPKMVGESEAFLRYRNRLEQAAKSSFPVLLHGETGTGKELAAEFIHEHSSRTQGQFVIVDCTSLTEDLFESELFGHEKGAFTGANARKSGLFELADQGTLFLDEIGELPLSQQAKLLRAMESGQFRRVGGTEVLRSDVRVVCATHRDLAQMVKDRLFREDLFYRLSVFPVPIPALRERKQDLPLLIDCFLEQAGTRENKHFSMSRPALFKLIKHDWPGNIRELKNCIQLAAGLQDGTEIALENINILRASTENEQAPAGPDNQAIELNPLDQMEVSYIKELMQLHDGNRKSIAHAMNISERTLYRKLKRYHLK